MEDPFGKVEQEYRVIKVKRILNLIHHVMQSRHKGVMWLRCLFYHVDL